MGISYKDRRYFYEVAIEEEENMFFKQKNNSTFMTTGTLHVNYSE